MNKNTESIGFLIAEVRTANGAIPIEGARVYVYESKEDDSGVIYSLRTDKSGMTEKVAETYSPKLAPFSPNKAICPKKGSMTPLKQERKITSTANRPTAIGARA